MKKISRCQVIFFAPVELSIEVFFVAMNKSKWFDILDDSHFSSLLISYRHDCTRTHERTHIVEKQTADKTE